MRRSTVKVISALTAAALATATGIAMAPSAFAAEVAGTSITSVSAVNILTGVNNQKASDITLAALPAVNSSDTITITIDDSDGTANCATATDFLTFAGVPTVTTTTGAAIALTPTLGNGACTGTSKDTLVLTATAHIDAGALVKISNVTYNVGADAATGVIRIATGANALSATHGNAFVTNVKATALSPNTLLAPSTPDQTTSSVAFTEQKAGAITATGACIGLQFQPTGTNFRAGSTPTVTASGGNGVPGAVTVDAVNHKVSFVVTTPSTTATTYTLSGIKVDTGAATGLVEVFSSSDCTSTSFSQSLRLGFIGTVDRLAGSDRYATAEKIAEAGPCVGGKPVVIARGDNFPDALSASYLAGRNGVPILLTAPNSMPNETLAALKNIGATSVILIGGPVAISETVAQILRNVPAYNCGGATTTGSNLAVDRAYGADRYGTARSVALRGATVGTADDGLDGVSCSAVPTAIVASGENFPDALAAGPLAFRGLTGTCGSGSLPLLLTHAGSLPTDTSNTISDMGIKQVILLGGTSAVATSVETAIDALPGVSVKRIAGPDRQGTAVFISQLEASAIGGWTGPRAFVARPDTFPDALAVAPLAGGSTSPLFLSAATTSLGGTANDGIATFGHGVFYLNAITLLGGTAALSDPVGTQAGTALAAQTRVS